MRLSAVSGQPSAVSGQPSAVRGNAEGWNCAAIVFPPLSVALRQHSRRESQGVRRAIFPPADPASHAGRGVTVETVTERAKRKISNGCWIGDKNNKKFQLYSYFYFFVFLLKSRKKTSFLSPVPARPYISTILR